MNLTNAAVLARGFCVNLTGKPCAAVLVATQEVKEKVIPQTAMLIDAAPDENDECIAGKFQAAYSGWKAKNAVSLKAGEVLAPGCIAVCANGTAQALVWIDDELDAARRRRDDANAAPVTKSSAACGAELDTAQRSDVVKNRIDLVTDGAQGIGEEIVRNLTAAGALVFIADLNLAGAEKLAAEINAVEKRTAAVPIKVNVSDEASVEAMFNTIAETAGGLDLCVSNAGVLKAGSMLEQPVSEFRFVTDINYTGFYIISKYAARLLAAQHLSAPDWMTDIIEINSKSGLEGSNKNAAYSGGKFGGLGLVASFAMELVEYNIKVNAICPGNFLNGPLWSDPEKGLFVQYLKAGKVKNAKTVADVRSYYEGKVPMKRGCTGKDVMRALYYIVEQEYETGQAVPVTGGQVMLH